MNNLKSAVISKRDEFINNFSVEKFKINRKAFESVIFMTIKNKKLFTKKDFISFISKFIDEPINDDNVFLSSGLRWYYKSSIYKGFYYAYSFKGNTFYFTYKGDVDITKHYQSKASFPSTDISKDADEKEKITLQVTYSDNYDVSIIRAAVGKGDVSVVHIHEKNWENLNAFLQEKIKEKEGVLI